jgi:hypothetical protein
MVQRLRGQPLEMGRPPLAREEENRALRMGVSPRPGEPLFFGPVAAEMLERADLAPPRAGRAPAMPAKRHSKLGRKRADWRRTSLMRVVARPVPLRDRSARTK